jgi:hypothetical protein
MFERLFHYCFKHLFKTFVDRTQLFFAIFKKKKFYLCHKDLRYLNFCTADVDQAENDALETYPL